MKKFFEYVRSCMTEDIFIGQGTQLQDPIPGTQITDMDVSPKDKQNKFKKKNTKQPK